MNKEGTKIFNDFSKVLRRNGYYLKRSNGGRFIFENDIGKQLSVPIRLNERIEKRLIKENDLK